jgi:cytochrome c biogenesis protein CcmG, thiol:disulfide interchange protein DsbE
MKQWRYWIPLASFVVLAGFLTAGLQLKPAEVPSPLLGKPAPQFALPRLDRPESILRNADMHGKVWMLNVWASWCSACRQEHPLLLDYARRQQIPIYGLNYKDVRPAAVQWLAHFGNPYTASLVDAQGQTGLDWGVYGVPETFIIDRQGLVRFKHVGPLTPEVLQKHIEPLVRQLNG